MTSHRVRDLLLALLTTGTVLLAADVVLREPAPGPARPAVTAVAVPPPTATAVSAAPSPRPAVASVLLLADDRVPVGQVAAAGRTLGWRLVPLLPLSAGTALRPALSGRDLVVLQSEAGQADRGAASVRGVRAADPDVDIVLIAPLGLDGRSLVEDRDVLRDAAEQVGAVFVDPIGSRWAASLPTALDASPSAAEQRLLGQRLVAALRHAQAVGALPGLG